jgi:hypothetical protein
MLQFIRPLQFCFRHSDTVFVTHMLHLAADNHFGLVEVRQRARRGSRTVGRG